MEANDLRYSERFSFQETALGKADAANQRRLEGMNEFRKAIDDITRTLIQRSEVEAMISNLAEKVEVDRDRLKMIEGQSFGMRAFWGYLIGGIGLVVAIVTTIVSLTRNG